MSTILQETTDNSVNYNKEGQSFIEESRIEMPWIHGWICPKCGRVYSPRTSMCMYCKNDIPYMDLPKVSPQPVPNNI